MVRLSSKARSRPDRPSRSLGRPSTSASAMPAGSRSRATAPRWGRSGPPATWSNAASSFPGSDLMADFSFDVVSKIDPQELDNALNQARKEIAGRFDFKHSIASIENTPTEITVLADDELKLKNVI